MSTHADSDCALLRAYRREPVPYTPVWFMRQAGRFDPAYRAIRRKVQFLDLVKRPDLATEVTVGAVRRLGTDAAIVFSDLLVPLEPMGLAVEYTEGRGPQVKNPVRSAPDVDRLAEFDAADALGFVGQTIRAVRAELGPRVPIIGFAGAPFTLASYAIEGGASRQLARTRAFMHADPGAWRGLLDRLARAAAGSLRAQIASGADAVQLFDSWVGCLSAGAYRRWVLPATRALVDALAGSVPVIHFGVGTAHLLEAMAEAGGDVAGLDSTSDLGEAWARLGPVAVQGNLDPAVLLAGSEALERAVREVLDRAGGRPGHVFNLGHGILPESPLADVRDLVDRVHAATAR